MALQNLETIDMVVKSLEDIPNGMELYIVDNGGIDDEIERYKLLTRKLATYLNFVVSEAFVDENPNTKISDIVIRVLCQRPPNEAMLEVKAVMPKNDLLIVFK
jgi:hypothetical protein